MASTCNSRSVFSSSSIPDRNMIICFSSYFLLFFFSFFFLGFFGVSLSGPPPPAAGTANTTIQINVNRIFPPFTTYWRQKSWLLLHHGFLFFSVFFFLLNKIFSRKNSSYFFFMVWIGHGFNRSCASSTCNEWKWKAPMNEGRLLIVP